MSDQPTDTPPAAAPAGVEEFTTVKSIFVRGRNSLLLTADFSPLFVDYYLHLMQHGLLVAQAVEGVSRLDLQPPRARSRQLLRLRLVDG